MFIEPERYDKALALERLKLELAQEHEAKLALQREQHQRRNMRALLLDVAASAFSTDPAPEDLITYAAELEAWVLEGAKE